MKILFVHQEITAISPFQPMAGGAAAMIDMAEALHGAGSDVTIAGILAEEENYRHQGVDYYHLGRNYDLDRHLGLLEDCRFDVVHAQRGWALMKASEYFPTAVLTLHVIDIFFDFHRVTPEAINGSADAVIAVSRFVKGALLHWGVKEEIIEVIHTGLRTSLFCRRPEIAREDNLVVFAGATVPAKGIVILLNAIDLLMRQDPSLGLEVYGSATMWGRKREYVNWSRVTAKIPNIVYKGACSQEDLARAFNRASVCVVPSDPKAIQEGFTGVSMEAQGCGCPVMVSKSGGLPETMIDGRTGVVVDPLDERSLAAAIRDFLANRALREEMSRRAERHAARFTWGDVARRFLDVVERERKTIPKARS